MALFNSNYLQKNKVNMKNLYWHKAEDRECLARWLSKGRLAIGSSDTVPGFISLVSADGKHALDSIKGRSLKPYIVLIKSIKQAAMFAKAEALATFSTFTEQCWPGPVTLIFPTAEKWVALLGLTVALRVPDHQGLQALLTHFDGLYSTSANRTQEPTPLVLSAVDQGLLQQVDVVIANAKGDEDEVPGVPSVLLDCTGSAIRVIRGKKETIDQLEELYGAPFVR